MTEPVSTSVFAMPSPFAGNTEPDRRTLLKLVGAGLVLGFAPLPELTSEALAADGAAKSLAPNPFVIVAPDNTVTVIIKHLDKGQGAATGLATLVAEEIGAAHAQIRTDFAPADADKYKNFAFGVQGVGGSTGLSNSFMQYREAGAAARMMLLAAAARAWGVDAATLKIADGVVSGSAGKSATFGALAEKAARESVPSKPVLKDPKDFVYIGKSFPRVDSPAKVKGLAKYTIDQQMPGMVIAVVARPPLFGGAAKSFDATATRQIDGIVDVIKIPRGVAVVATSTWAAIKGREALKVEWDLSNAEKRGSQELREEYRALLDKDGTKVREEGDTAEALKSAARVVEAEFEFPYLAHAPLEPMNAVVRFDGSRAEIWTGSQLQTVDHAAAAGIFRLKPESIQLHTVWAGGSFGRRAIADSHYVAEACEIAKAMGTGQPVKLIWTREDDIKGGYYRPMYVHRIRAGLDKDGNIVAWLHRIVGQSIIKGTPFAASILKDGFDQTSVEGASTLPYAIPNLKVDLHTTDVKVPVLWWRSVGSTHTAHATEHMIDILARETGKDPVAYRLAMLEKHPRHAGALKLAAEKAGWGTPLPAGMHRGAAVHESFKSYVAQIADLSLKEDGTYRVERVVCAIDCGLAVNPDVVKAQMEGGIGFGLGAALKSAVTLKGGEVEQSNYHDYEVLRISEMPKVEVYIVPSNEPPTGVGEPGTPVGLPAVSNALLSATGVRTNVLPMRNQIYKPQA